MPLLRLEMPYRDDVRVLTVLRALVLRRKVARFMYVRAHVARATKALELVTGGRWYVKYSFID